MKSEYAAYLDELIEEHRQHFAPICQRDLTRRDLVRAQCQAFTKAFVLRFPHLKAVAGFYGSAEIEHGEPDFDYVEHWWCVDVDGTIVDPTREQFGEADRTYTVYDPDVHRVQIGRCMNCGDYIYGLRKNGTRCVCSAECESELQHEYERHQS